MPENKAESTEIMNFAVRHNSTTNVILLDATDKTKSQKPENWVDSQGKSLAYSNWLLSAFTKKRDGTFAVMWVRPGRAYNEKWFVPSKYETMNIICLQEITGTISKL